MGLTRKHLLVRGRVQGVGYRWFVAETARACRVTGWVRNLPDGSVEAEGQGSPAAVAGFVSALRRGPRLAVVDCVDEQVIDARGGEAGFDIH